MQGFLALYGHLMQMLSRRRALGDRRALMLYGPLYEKYEASLYWYESTIIVTRTAFVLITLFVTEPTMQASDPWVRLHWMWRLLLPDLQAAFR